MQTKPQRAAAKPPIARWELKLYVAGQTAKSLQALANLQKICEEHLPVEYDIEIVDLLKTPQLAKGDQILALPTLVRRLPAPPLRKQCCGSPRRPAPDGSGL